MAQPAVMQGSVACRMGLVRVCRLGSPGRGVERRADATLLGPAGRCRPFVCPDAPLGAAQAHISANSAMLSAETEALRHPRVLLGQRDDALG